MCSLQRCGVVERTRIPCCCWHARLSEERQDSQKAQPHHVQLGQVNNGVQVVAERLAQQQQRGQAQGLGRRGSCGRRRRRCALELGRHNRKHDLHGTCANSVRSVHDARCGAALWRSSMRILSSHMLASRGSCISTLLHMHGAADTGAHE
jgi:hypothetical protein